jgi:hypothetical protein
MAIRGKSSLTAILWQTGSTANAGGAGFQLLEEPRLVSESFDQLLGATGL